MTVTSLYAAILTLMFLFLSVRVIKARTSLRIGLGDGGDKAMLRRIRVHANFAEYVPLALILMALAELQGARGWMIHLIGLALIAARLIHFYGFGSDQEKLRFRIIGMAMTIGVLACAALLNLGLRFF